MPERQQEAVIHFLKTSAETGDAATPAQLIFTHISVIVLRGDRAWKLKRALRLPYLDFSTPGQRLQACEQELRLNRRTAPALYLAARRITRDAAGGLTLDGNGPLVDAVVEMRRFPEGSLLSDLARRGALDAPLLETVAARIAEFHAQAEIHRQTDGAARMAAVLALGEQAGAMVPAFGTEPVHALWAALRAGLARHEGLLDIRARAGRVRRCHGDLHLRNLCLLDGMPTLFDCIEFDDALATIDVLYDLAFLLMDLWHLQLRAEANRILNRYLDLTDDDDGLAVLPWFMALRATIRAQVMATQWHAGGGTDTALHNEAAGYLALAHALLTPDTPRLLAIGGLSGTGKSTVAALLAPHIGPAPGARILASDRLRKKMAGVSAQSRLPAESYTTQASQAVYARLMEKAGAVLAGGWPVLADAVFAQPSQRDALRACAQTAGVPFQGIWLHAPAEQLLARVAARRNDPSDATEAVVRVQLEQHEPPEDWIMIAADATPDISCRRILERL
ncbi:MAG: AAA family ATPase [Castellaniella sp.]